MWLGHTFYGRGIPNVAVRSKRSGSTLNVEARVESVTAIQDVKLFYAYNETNDWRFATWSPRPMNMEGNQYSAELDIKKGKALAYYVEVEDRDKSGKGLISSLVDIINHISL